MPLKLRKTIVNICRIVLAVVFVFSGFVKAVDPLGTVYKFQDYLAAASFNAGSLPERVLIVAAIALSAFEFVVGIFLLFGIHRHLASRLALIFMVVMTILTVWIYVADPVKDCGCFGDAIVLTNGQTLLKNILLLACAAISVLWFKNIIRFISQQTQWVVVNYSIWFIIGISVWCVHTLPIFDFRPYHIGADFRTDTEIPEGEEQPQFETTFILQKNGVEKEFSIDNYPDSTWTFVDSKTVQTSQGYIPPMYDLLIEDTKTSDNLTDDIVKSDGITLLLIAPNLAKADDGNFGEIEQIYEYAISNNLKFCCLTASDSLQQADWRDATGAEYDFYFADNTLLKTMIRSNPGLMMVNNGIIVGKWSCNTLPSENELARLISDKDSHKKEGKSLMRKAVAAVLWFVVPLLLLTLADRLWAWSRWAKRITRLKKLKRQNNKEK